MKEKLKMKNIIIALIGGIFAKEIFRFGFALALQNGYGIDTDVYLGSRAIFNFPNVICIIVSSLLMGIFVGIVVKRKGWIFACAVPLLTFLLVYGLSFILIAFKGLTESGKVWFKNSLIDGSIWTGIEIIFCSIGGYIGEAIRKAEKLTAEGEKEGVTSYYFAPKLRLFFTIPFLSFVVIYMFVFQARYFGSLLSGLQ